MESVCISAYFTMSRRICFSSLIENDCSNYWLLFTPIKWETVQEKSFFFVSSRTLERQEAPYSKQLGLARCPDFFASVQSFEMEALHSNLFKDSSDLVQYVCQ